MRQKGTFHISILRPKDHIISMNLRQVFRESIGQAKCDVVGHDIDPQILKRKFSEQSGPEKLEKVICKRCYIPLLLRVDKVERSYYVSELY